MYHQHDAWLNPAEDWIDVQQWHPEDETKEATDRHYLEGRRIRHQEAHDTLYRLGFVVRGEWQKSYARPGQWHAILDRITEAGR